MVLRTAIFRIKERLPLLHGGACLRVGVGHVRILVCSRSLAAKTGGCCRPGRDEPKQRRRVNFRRVCWHRRSDRRSNCVRTARTDLQITPAAALQMSNSDGRQGPDEGFTETAGASGEPMIAAPSAATKASSSKPPQDAWWTIPVPHRPIPLAGGRASVDANEVPIVGDPAAKIVVVEVFDYTCPQCRSLHHHLQESIAPMEARWLWHCCRLR